MLLKELSPGARGRIVALRKEQPEYRRRLLMLGATPGAEIRSGPHRTSGRSG